MLNHFEANRDSAGNGLQLLPGVLQLMQTLQVRTTDTHAQY